MQIEEHVRQFVIDNFVFGEDHASFSNDDSFLEKGLVDSMGVLTLVEFVKEAYAIPIEDEELVPENWDSVSRIAAFIQTKNRQIPVSAELTAGAVNL
jgi:acyl carrier protein